MPYTSTYRSKDYSIILEIETDDPFDMPDTKTVDGVKFLRLPSGGKNGWKFQTYTNGETCIDELVPVNDAPDSFVRDGKTFTKSTEIGIPGIGAGSAGKCSQDFIKVMEALDKRAGKKRSTIMKNMV